MGVYRVVDRALAVAVHLCFVAVRWSWRHPYQAAAAGIAVLVVAQ
jgi:hypothetical protein